LIIQLIKNYILIKLFDFGNCEKLSRNFLFFNLFIDSIVFTRLKKGDDKLKKTTLHHLAVCAELVKYDVL